MCPSCSVLKGTGEDEVGFEQRANLEVRLSHACLLCAFWRASYSSSCYHQLLSACLLHIVHTSQHYTEV